MTTKEADTRKGLIAAYIIDTNNRRGCLVEWPKINQWEPKQGLLWIHLDYMDKQARAWLENSSNLDTIVTEALLEEETRPRYSVINGGLLVTLRGVNLNPGAEPEDMVAIRLWIDKDRVISTRGRYMPSEKSMFKAIEEGQAPDSSSQFLIDLTYFMIEQIADVIDNIEDKIDQIDDEIDKREDDNPGHSQQDLRNFRRQIMTLRRYLAPQRDVMLRLAAERIDWLDDRDRLHLKEIAEIISLNIEDLEEAKEQINITQEQILSQISNKANRRMYILSLMASIFLPLTFVTGLLGINVGGIPGSHNPYAFSLITGSLIAIAIFMYIYLKLKNWM